jgi:hypothetical protein
MFGSLGSPRRVRARLHAALFHAREQRRGRLLAPPASTQGDVDHAENSPFSLTLEDGSGDWVTTVQISPELPQLSFDGADLAGTLPSVSEPTDHVVSVRRRNGYGVSYATFTLTILNTEQGGR